MNFQDRLNRIRESAFVRSVLVLTGGAAFAQLISIAILPLLTRLYSPDDFNVLAFYSSVLAMLAAVSALRYEIAIPLPEDDAEAEKLLFISVLSTVLISFLVLVISIVFSDALLGLFKLGDNGWVLYLLPVGVLLAGIYNAFRSWATRKKQFALIAKTRIQQSLGAAASQLLLGWFKYSPFGLVIGQIIEAGAGVRGLVQGYLADKKRMNQEQGVKNTLLIAREYIRFPKYSVLESLANSAGIQVPVLIIVALAVGGEAGFLLLATKIMAGPMRLIGAAVAQVYYSNAAIEYRKGGFEQLTINTVSGLIKVGVGPLIFVAVLAPLATPLVLGEGWGRVGEIILWMLPWTIMQLVSSPISMSMHVVGAQRGLMLLTIGGLFLRVGGLYLGYVLSGAVSVELYSVLSAVYYLICCLVFLSFSGVRVSNVLPPFLSALTIPLLWLIGAMVIKFIWEAI